MSEDAAQIHRLLLPDLLRRLAERFGLAIALRFAADFGGRLLYLPKKAASDHHIAVAVGLPVLEWLIGEFRPGEKVLVPLGPHSSYSRRIAEIRRLLQAGESAATIVQIVQCHGRTVRRHRKTLRERDDRQGKLL